MTLTVPVPYEDYTKLIKDSADKAAIETLLQTEFPDDTCQLIAIKSVLGIVENEEEPTTDPNTPPGTDPSDPTGGANPSTP